ncbi:MAG: DUF4349 domain-containing protein [Chloroflexi bacterium]|nr:DUF4349 domain-containing protein [Chloroflexota bacterium]
MRQHGHRGVTLRRCRAGLAALAIGALTLGACGEAETVEKMVMASEAPPAAATAAPQAVVIGEVQVEKVVTQEVVKEVEFAREVSVEKVVTQEVIREAVVEKLVTAAPAAGSSGALPEGARAAPTALVAERHIIRTGTLSMVVNDLPDAVTQIREVVARIPGAFIASSNVQRDDPDRTSTMTVRIPSESFDPALTALRGIGAEVVDEDISSQDVTEQYTDLAARLRNAKVTEQRLLDILGRAKDVEETLEVEAEVAKVRERVELMQGQLNVLTNQTTLATLVMQLHTVADLILERDPVRNFQMHGQTLLGLTVYNQGTVDLAEVEVVDRLDPDMIFVNATEGYAFDDDSNTVSWTIDRLGPGQSVSLRTEVRLEGDGRAMQARAEVSTTSPERDPGNNSADTELRFHVDLAVAKDGGTVVTSGDEISYSVDFRNLGNADARNVRLEERLPEGMAFVRASGAGRHDATRNTIVWEYPRLGPGFGDRVSYVARVDTDSGHPRVDTTISSDETDRVEVDNMTNTFLTVLPEPEEEMEPTPEPTPEPEPWDPGAAARESADRLGRFGQWVSDTVVTVGIIGGPIVAVLGVIGGAAYAIRRRLTRT